MAEKGDSALDGILSGLGGGEAGAGAGAKAAPKPPASDPQLDAALGGLTPRTDREARLMASLKATEPKDIDLVSGLPMLGADWAAGALAGRALRGLAERVGLPAVGRFLTGAAGGIARLPSLATSGAIQGAASAGVNRLFGDQTPLSTAAAVGAGVNALTGGIGRALFGSEISQEAAQRAQGAIAAGVPLRTGNIPGASFAARLAGKLSGATRPDLQAYTRSIMKSVGSDADILSGETLAAAKARLQGDPGNLAAGIPPTLGEFDRIAQRAKPITWTSAPGLRRELADILAEAQNKYGLMQNPDEMRRVLGQVQNVYDAVNAGGLTGEQLQAITAGTSALSSLASGGTAGSYLGTRLKRALYNAAAQADPETARALSLARNQYRNIAMLEPKVEQLTDASGLVDPVKLGARIRGSYGNFEAASRAGAAAGAPGDLGALGEAGARFGQQPVGKPSLTAAIGLGTGAATLGAEELAGGFPLWEALASHPLMGLGATAGMLGTLGTTLPVGAAQNTRFMTNLLLARAARGAGGPLAGANPLVGLGVASQGADMRAGEQNWNNWLRGQSFLESPSGAPSSSSSAKGYFQFLDGTAKKALAAGLPDPQHGDYTSQAAATRAYIEHFYPAAAKAIAQGDFATAVPLLRGEWPSLPGGSQPQSDSQYSQWGQILRAQ